MQICSTSRDPYQACTCPRIESRVPASPNPNETIYIMSSVFRHSAQPTRPGHRISPRESPRLTVTETLACHSTMLQTSSVPHSLVKSPRADACTHGRRHTSLSLKPSLSAALPGDPHGDPAGTSGLSRRAQGTATGVARPPLAQRRRLLGDRALDAWVERAASWASRVSWPRPPYAPLLPLLVSKMSTSSRRRQGFGLLELCESL